MTSVQIDEWFVRFRQDAAVHLRLFCFPYAGGSAWIYRSWAERMPPGVELLAIQLPGRGSRVARPPFVQLTPLIEEASDALRPLLDRPFVLFGHSLGALIAFELARHLHAVHRRLPARLFVSGRRGPRIPRERPPLHNLPDAEFLEEVSRLNGLPPELLASEELQQLLLPPLRADFTIAETHGYTSGIPLDCPITAFGGSADDEVAIAHLEAWAAETSGAFSLEMFPGDHFFIRTVEGLVLERLSVSLHGALAVAHHADSTCSSTGSRYPRPFNEGSSISATQRTLT